MITDPEHAHWMAERDTVLLAADVLARAALGDDWTLEAHMVLKRALLGIVDGVKR